MPLISAIEGFYALNSIAGRSDRIDAIFIFGAVYLIVIMAAALVGYMVFSWKTSHFEGRFENLTHVSITVILAFITERLIGFFYFRPRPFVDLEGVVKIIEKSPEAASFPSGHATIAFALAFGMMIHNRRWGWVFTVLALYVGISRIIVGVHYPADVVGGIIVAAVAAAITAPIKRKIEPYLELFPVFRKFKRTKPAKDLL